ncbi:hypothetical protein BUALT_Bualt01G0236800 [Buddleja alternifolia]|uniref:Uncharacterized protein n=1 Tax=Buddleja alternifolia TaxID=168488 RepID=A0AAV6YFD1_9LAMI|nr:hypothetical protein BUALT_Bualt01G0236800 [Buddleja alternifolia]
MAEPVVNMDQENKIVEEDQTNESLLAGVNLIMILSFLSLSPDEKRSNLKEIEEMGSCKYYHKAKDAVSRSNFPRRREVNGFPSVERHAAKVHTKIRDCRHCRRL